MAEHVVQRAPIAGRRGGELVELARAGLDVLGDPQRRHGVQAPRRGQVRKFPEIGHTADSNGGAELTDERYASH